MNIARPSSLRLASLGLCFALVRCAGSDGRTADTSLYALVQGIDGVYFYPPLGPEPTPSAAFDPTLLDGLSMVIEAEDAAANISVLGTFDAHTHPAVALLGEHERYWVNIPAATYVTDPASTYRIRVLLDGSELGTSVLSAHVFEVLAYEPALPIGVAVRIEGTGAVRAVSRTRLQAHGAPLHCSDGVRNKDETGVDCGGSCAPCCVPGGACSTGLLGACAAGVVACTASGPTCAQTVFPTAETCNGVDDDCDGAVDEDLWVPSGAASVTSVAGRTGGDGVYRSVTQSSPISVAAACGYCTGDVLCLWAAYNQSPTLLSATGTFSAAGGVASCSYSYTQTGLSGVHYWTAGITVTNTYRCGAGCRVNGAGCDCPCRAP